MWACSENITRQHVRQFEVVKLEQSISLDASRRLLYNGKSILLQTTKNKKYNIKERERERERERLLSIVFL